ncbi:MAG: polysaccharide deacetylase family protein [Candidatus Bathyarchaeia archaeon]|nr:polysaccharide deacetylase family protein [Candidatus Bathyarchaeia archaeon]
MKADESRGYISITFDDGGLSQFVYAWPLMQARGIVGTFYIVTDHVGGDYLSVDQLQVLEAAGNEIASHSKTHPPFTYLTDQEIREECGQSKEFLENYGFDVSNFAYPGGDRDERTDAIVSEYFRSARGANWDLLLDYLPISDFLIPGFMGETGDGTVLSRLMSAVDEIYAADAWANIYFHNIAPGLTDNPYGISTADFEAFLDYVVLKGITTLTVDQALDYGGNHRPNVEWYSPSESILTAAVTESIEFMQVSSDPDGDTLAYDWQLDTDNVATTQNWTWNSLSEGTHDVSVTVSDGSLTDRQEWTVIVGEAPSFENVHLVVRGNDGTVYYRFYDTILDLWGDWIPLPGSTCDSPAAALLNNNLHIVVRGMDEHTLWHGYYNLTSKEFVGWTMLEGSSPSPPVLTSNGTMLCLVVRGMNDLIYYKCYKEDVWGDWQLLPNGATIDGPAAALLGDELHVVVRGMDGFSMWHKIIVPEGSVVQDWTLISGASASPPVLVASQSRGELYMLVHGTDDGIYGCYYGGSWDGWISLEGLTVARPGAAICGDELHVIVQGADAVTLWHFVVDLETDVFGSWSWISGSTPSAPTLTS